MEIRSGFQLLVFFLYSTFYGGLHTSSSYTSIFYICKHNYNMLLCQVTNVYESGGCGKAQNMNPWLFCQTRSLLKSWDWISETEDRKKRNKIPKLGSRVFQDLEDENLRIQQHRWKKLSEDRNQIKRDWLLPRTQLKGRTVQRTIDNNQRATWLHTRWNQDGAGTVPLPRDVPADILSTDNTLFNRFILIMMYKNLLCYQSRKSTVYTMLSVT